MTEPPGQFKRARAHGEVILLHCVDHELLRLLRVSGVVPADRLEREFTQIAQVALAMSEAVVMPAASYFEAAWTGMLLKKFSPLVEAGRIFLTGNGPSVIDYHAQKAAQFQLEPTRHRRYQESLLLGEARRLTQAWLPKAGSSTTTELGELWRSRVESGDPRMRQILERNPHPGLEDALMNLPETLGENAFLAPFAVQLLQRTRSGLRLTADDERIIDEIVAIDYAFTYMREHEATLLVDLPLNFGTLVPSGRWISYRRIVELLAAISIHECLMRLTPEQLLSIALMPEYQLLRRDLVLRASRNGPAWEPHETASGSFKAFRSRYFQLRHRDPESTILAVAERYLQDIQRSTESREQDHMDPTHQNGPQFHGDVGEVTVGPKIHIGDTHIDLRVESQDQIVAAVLAILMNDRPPGAVAEELRKFGEQLGRGGDVDSTRISAAVKEALTVESEDSDGRLRRLADELAANAGGNLVVEGALRGLQLLLG